MAQEVDKWLEKELLTKEQYDKIYSDKRLDKSTSKRADKVYKDNKNKFWNIRTWLVLRANQQMNESSITKTKLEPFIFVRVHLFH